MKVPHLSRTGPSLSLGKGPIHKTIKARLGAAFWYKLTRRIRLALVKAVLIFQGLIRQGQNHARVWLRPHDKMHLFLLIWSPPRCNLHFCTTHCQLFWIRDIIYLKTLCNAIFLADIHSVFASYWISCVFKLWVQSFFNNWNCKIFSFGESNIIWG